MGLCFGRELTTKLLIVGETGSGKTCLIKHLAFAQPTNFIDYARQDDIQIWEIAGVAASMEIGRPYFEGVNAVLLIFNNENQESFNQLRDVWLPYVRFNAHRETPLYLLENNFGGHRVVDDNQINQFATTNHLIRREVNNMVLFGIRNDIHG